MLARGEITETLLEARRLLSKSQSDLNTLREHELIALHARLEDLTDRLGGLVPGATPPGRIEEFFTQVGEGMMASQAELDRQSFAHNVARPPGALPNAYRIPKVQAEIGFTMSRKRHKGFSFLALGNKSDREKAHSNTVSFEIVATPPVPQSMDEIGLAAEFVTQPSTREQVKKMLRSAESEGQGANEARQALLNDFGQVLVIVRQGEWLLCQPQWGEKPTLLFGTLTPSPLVFISHGPVPASQAKQSRFEQLFAFFSAISLEQSLSLATAQSASIAAAD